MNVKQVIDIIMKDTDNIKICLEMENGISGKEYIHDQNSIYDFIKGYENYEIWEFIYDKKIKSLPNKTFIERDIPHLYICYKK